MSDNTAAPKLEDQLRHACEDARQDRALNAEMKRLWNTQTPNVRAERPGTAGEKV